MNNIEYLSLIMVKHLGTEAAFENCYDCRDLAIWGQIFNEMLK